jgi:hypothetical protein
MTIDATPGVTAPPQPPASTDNNTAAAKANNAPVSGAAAVASSKQQLNIAIVQSSLTVSLSTKNDPLTLVYKSAIEHLNEQLKPTLGDNAIQNAVSQDNSPEGTAGRIVSLSTGLFELYKQSFPGEDESKVLDRFMKVIQGGINTGFKEARGILSGMGVLGGSIASNIDKTYTLVTQGLADFMAATKAKIAAETGATGQAADGSNGSDGTSNTAS